jgi:hypothetical protein
MKMQMSLLDPTLSLSELLKLAGDAHLQLVELSQSDLSELTALLKERGRQELDYGEELAVDNARLVKRVNGAVGIYYS